MTFKGNQVFKKKESQPITALSLICFKKIVKCDKSREEEMIR